MVVTKSKKYIVVSAVNLTEGGTLTVLKDCLHSAALKLSPEWEIIALVHKDELINEPRVKCISFPKAKSRWLFRLYYEWIYFRKISLELKPDLWLSLHDMTPRVTARRQAVYCHNPSPFYNLSVSEAWIEPKLWLFSKLYSRLYGIFIESNDFIIVQQDWLRQEFATRYNCSNIVVAHPSVKETLISDIDLNENNKKIIFLYPALPRVFKNFEVISEAVKILNMRGVTNFEARITISGYENRYANGLFRQYSKVPNLSFIGLQNKIEMARQYNDAQVVIFPSKLETWGLPITEAKAYNKQLLIADLLYAKETVGTYDKVDFFHPTDIESLANLMQKIIADEWKPNGAIASKISKPFVKDWSELWKLLIKDL